MNLENLKESVQDALDDAEVKQAIKEEIDKAAEEKAQILLNKKIEEEIEKTSEEIDKAAEEKAQILFDKKKQELEEEYEQKLDDLEEHCNKFKKHLIREADKLVKAKVSKMKNVLERFSTRVVNEFFMAHAEDFKMYENVQQTEAILESLRAVIAIAGVDVQDIIKGSKIRDNKQATINNARIIGLKEQVEKLQSLNKSLQEENSELQDENADLKLSIDDIKEEHEDKSEIIKDLEEEICNLKSSNDDLKDAVENEKKIQESIKKEKRILEKENKDVVRLGVIQELKSGLTLTESKKFEKLAKDVPFTADKNYIKKLKNLKESVQDLPSLNEVTSSREIKLEDKKTPDYHKFL
jgi:hypothetical protein